MTIQEAIQFLKDVSPILPGLMVYVAFALAFIAGYFVLSATFGSIRTLADAWADRIRGVELSKFYEEREALRPVHKHYLFEQPKTKVEEKS